LPTFSFGTRGAKEKVIKKNAKKNFARYDARPKALPLETASL
jgi:hypothetical protein